MRARPLLLLVLVVVALLLVVPGIARAVGGGGDEPTVIYVVRPGDTLWGIARRADPDGDPRPLVDRLSGANDVRGGLRPGDRLRLPAELAGRLTPAQPG
jgi:nucleoid-associated protein YgaU